MRENVRVRSISGPFSPAFELTQSECGKKRTRKTPITDTFYAVHIIVGVQQSMLFSHIIF